MKLKYKNLPKEISDLIRKCKEKCYQGINAKLNDLLLSKKTYWSIQKTFFNGEKNSVMPSLFINKKFVANFFKKKLMF